MAPTRQKGGSGHIVQNLAYPYATPLRCLNALEHGKSSDNAMGQAANQDWEDNPEMIRSLFAYIVVVND